MEEVSNKEEILANFQVCFTRLVLKFLIGKFTLKLQQITAIEDIGVALSHLESTGWDLEVRK